MTLTSALPPRFLAVAQRSFCAFLTVVLLLGTAAAAGCRSCIERGCVDLLHVSADLLPAGMLIDVCIKDSCTRIDPGTTRDARIWLSAREKGLIGDSIEVTVRRTTTTDITGSEEKRNVRLMHVYPNGRDCPKSCVSADMHFNHNGNIR